MAAAAKRPGASLRKFLPVVLPCETASGLYCNAGKNTDVLSSKDGKGVFSCTVRLLCKVLSR